MNVLGYQIKYYRGYHLNIEFLIRSMIEIFGWKDTLEFCAKKIGSLSWQDDGIEEF